MYFTQGLHRAVQQHPDRMAVRFGDRQRAFREFADRVARLAGALRALGMDILSSVIDRSAGRLVVHRVRRRALLRKVG